MLIITPISAVTGLVTFDPANWGGKPTIVSILGMSLFGLISIQGWITYIPSIIFTPILMKRYSEDQNFYSMHIAKFIAYSIFGGMLAGIFILLPFIGMAATESVKLFLNWLWAGIFAGSITYVTIALIYRYGDD